MAMVETKDRDALEVAAMCVAAGRCENCPMNAAMHPRAMDCVQYQERFPAEAAEIARRYMDGKNAHDAQGCS